MLFGPHHRGLTTMRTFFTCSLNWEFKSEHGVRPSTARLPANIFYTSLDNTPLHSIPSVCRPWGEGLLSSGVVNMSVGNRVGVCLTRTIRLLLLSLFPVRGSSKQRPHSSEPTRIGYCSSTNRARHFRCEDNNVDLMCVQPHHYRVRSAEPYHLLG